MPFTQTKQQQKVLSQCPRIPWTATIVGRVYLSGMLTEKHTPPSSHCGPVTRPHCALTDRQREGNPSQPQACHHHMNHHLPLRFSLYYSLYSCAQWHNDSLQSTSPCMFIYILYVFGLWVFLQHDDPHLKNEPMDSVWLSLHHRGGTVQIFHMKWTGELRSGLRPSMIQ
jgi:hypothetical protein